MKNLNFYPYYRDLLERRVKTTTLRLPGSLTFEPGEAVLITVGWPGQGPVEELHPAVVERVYERRIRDLTAHDLEGESPDCVSVDAVKFVLGAIYRKVLRDDELIHVIKFRHSE